MCGTPPRTMRGAVVATSLFLAACGEQRADVDRPAPALATVPVERPRADPPPASPARDPRFDALLAALRTAEDDGDLGAVQRAQDEIVALGEPAIARLVALLADRDEGHRASRLLCRFGAAACPALAAALADPASGLHAAITLRELAPDWSADPCGPDVARALLRLMDDVPELADLAGTALARSGRAGRAVAADLCAKWFAGCPVAPGGAMQAPSPHVYLDGDGCSFPDCADAGDVLISLGADGAPAVPFALRALREGSVAWARLPLTLLRSVGADAPGALPVLRELLSSDDAGLRAGALDVLSAWDDAAAPAAPDVLRLLRSTSEHADVRLLAAFLLARLPSAAGGAWRDLVAAAAATPDGSGPNLLEAAARHPEYAARIAAGLTTLRAEEQEVAYGALVDAGYADLPAVAATLLRDPRPETRRLAFLPWIAERSEAPLPAAAADLLRDPDASVRGVAAWMLAAHGAAPPADLRRVAEDLLRSQDPDPRGSGVATLGVLAREDPALVLVLAGALDDADAGVRWEALLALARLDGPIPGRHERALDDLLGHASLAAFLLRLEGGPDALVTDLCERLARGAPVAVRWQDLRALGPAAQSLRPAVAAALPAATGDRADALAALLARLDGDAAALARGGWPDAEELLAMGRPGRDALVLLADRTCHQLETLESAWDAGDLELAQAVIEAAGATGADGATRRCGAAALAPSLGPDAAAALLARLLGDADERVFRVAAEALVVVERRSPGAVPLATLERALGHPDAWVRRTALDLTSAVGTRARDLAPAVRAVGRGAPLPLRVRAAIAAWRATGDRGEALPAVREVLARPETLDDVDDDVVAAMRDVGLDASDLPALVRALRWDAAESRGARLVPVLEPFGAAAAPAVDALRRLVGSDDGACVFRLLAAIGPPARDALPDLRRWAGTFGDPDGLARAAIRAIEARPAR